MPDPTAPDDLLSMGERPTQTFSRRKRNSPTEPCGRPRSESPSQSQIRRLQNLVRVCWKGCFRRWNDHHRILSPSRLGSNVKKMSPIQNLHIGYHTPFTFPAKNYFPLHQRPHKPYNVTPLPAIAANDPGAKEAQRVWTSVFCTMLGEVAKYHLFPFFFLFLYLAETMIERSRFSILI